MANAFNLSSSTPAAPAGNRNVTFQVDASSIPNVSAYVPALSFTAPLVDTSNVISLPVATASADGYLSHTDWVTFNGKQAPLTFPLSVAQGGTGEVTASAARTNLGAAASGANADITSLSGLTTPLSIAQGGTGASSAATALSNLGGIALSANNAFTGNNTFAGTTGLNGAVTLGAGLNLNAQAISGAATFSGNLTFNGSSTFGGNCFFTPNSPQFFNTPNVTWQEFQIIAVHGGTAANDQFAIQYNSRTTLGGADSWGSVFTIAAQTGALALNTATALNAAVTLNAGLNLNGQTISGNATFSGGLTFTGGATFENSVELAISTAATSSSNVNGSPLWITGNYWTGSASALDIWQIQDQLGSGANPTSTLSITHSSGSTGSAVVSLPALTCGAATFSGAVTQNAGFTFGALGTATSSANKNSQTVTFDASYWTGSAAATDTWIMYVNLGTGSNPSSALTLTHSGSSNAVFPLILQQAGQAQFDLWNVTTGGTPSTGAHWRLFADNVSGGGGNNTFAIYDVANSRLAFGIDNSGNATFIAKINTTLWNVQPVLGNAAGALPVSGSFTTHGGTVWMTVTGSGYAATAGTIIGANISVDGVTRSTMKIFANVATTHIAFIPVTFMITGLTAGSHTVSIAALSGTTTDFYNVDLIEFPF